MYEPKTNSLLGTGESVLVLTDDSWRVGEYTGVRREASESFEIEVYDPYTAEVDFVSFFHKEDIYQNTTENVEKLKSMTA